MKSKWLLKIAVRLMKNNRELMLIILFWILEELVKSTDNKVDDKVLKMLKEMLGADGKTNAK